MSKKCIGCGVVLQDKDKNLDGYVENIDHMICERCFMIKNYGRSKDINKSNVDYMKIINNIKGNDLVVYVSSILTVNLDYLDRFKNVILVLTKRDIIPKSVKDMKIITYLKNRYKNIIDIVIVSAYKKYNLDILYNDLLEYGKNKKIYFVGITNSGKSSLINEMIKSYNGTNGMITTSNYPSTTLGIVEVKIGELVISDTPGLIVRDSIVNYLDNKDIKMINSKKEIKPVTFQIKGSGVILINDILRVEYETDISSMTFYMSNNLTIKSISKNNPRLNDSEYIELDISDNQDIVIEDVGFIKCTNKLKARVLYRDKISVRIRDNLI